MDQLLMIPGPTGVSQRVLKAMLKNIVNHRGEEFGKILEETSEMMSKIFKTKNESYILTGSGTAAMEAALANILEEGDKILNIVNGKFGERFMQITTTFGGNSIPLKFEWGKAADIEKIKETLEENEDIKAVTVVHNETSTGVKNPIKEIGKILNNHEALYIVDAVSSLGGDKVEVDNYGIDICITGSQKCLAAPPGLSAITLSDEAWDVVESTDSKTYYLDLKKYRESKSLKPPETPYTPSVSLIYALNEALKVVEEEGLENRIKRHKMAAIATRKAVKALGLEIFPDEEVSSNTVTAIHLPKGTSDKEFRGLIRKKYGVELAGGQDHLKGKIFRIGHMGNITQRELTVTISAIELALKELGFDIELGKGVSKILEVFSS